MMRNEYPRPDFVRDSFIALNGEWDFAFDDNNVGHREKWYEKGKFNKKIQVPFCFESKLSGIGDTSFHDHVWYERSFEVPELHQNERCVIHFNSIDYYSEIYINGHLVKSHTGGETRISADITDCLHGRKNKVCVYAYDPGRKEDIPRGKQYWEEKSDGIFYTRTTGIWKSVWLEIVNACHLESVFMTPDIDHGVMRAEMNVSCDRGEAEITVRDGGEIVDRKKVKIRSDNLIVEMDIFHQKVLESPVFHFDKLWSPDNPHLYDIEFKVYDADGNLADTVKSYFGMRKIEAVNGRIYLNNRPFYQKLVLIQGYYPDGIMTAPEIADIENDIAVSKELGFNGARVHQKVEDPYFYYLADKMGFVLWCESASCFRFSKDVPERMVTEWIEIVKENYNHPSIITWTPLNESWGVQNISHDPFQQSLAMMLYYTVHSLDATRFVISNDGWEHCKTDLCTIHNYAHGGKDELKKQDFYAYMLKNRSNLLTIYPADKPIFVPGYENQNVPILLTEYGGIAYKEGQTEGWGYTVSADKQEYLADYERIHRAIARSNALVGFCYTQLYDVEQEINGILTYDRKPKVEIGAIRKINDSVRPLIAIEKE